MAAASYPYLGAFLNHAILDAELLHGVAGYLPEISVVQPDSTHFLDGATQFGFFPADAHQAVPWSGGNGGAFLDDDFGGGEAAPAFGIGAVAHADESVAEAFG